MMIVELARPVALHDLGTRSTHHSVTAKPAELVALATRFSLARLDALTAEFDVRRDAAGVRVTGTVTGKAVQICVVSGADVPAMINEAVDLLFTPLAAPEAEEIELSAPDLDVLPLEGESVDLGEIAAETLGLALDPFPHSSDSALAYARGKLVAEEEALRLAAQDAADRNPFRVLKGGKEG